MLSCRPGAISNLHATAHIVLYLEIRLDWPKPSFILRSETTCCIHHAVVVAGPAALMPCSVDYAGQKVRGVLSDTVISQCHVPWPIDHNAWPWICPIPSKYHAYIHSDTSTFNSAVGTAIHYTTYFFLHTGFTLQSDNQLKSIMCTCCTVT